MKLSRTAILLPRKSSPDGSQYADAPLELSVVFAALILLQHALKDKAQVCRIHRHRLVDPVANELAVADIVGPRLN